MVRALVSTQRWEELAEEALYNASRLAQMCHFSTRQLQRVFQRTFGRPPQDWLNHQRMRKAQQLLLGGQPVKAIAFELGFKQPSHFCRQFKSWNNMTPSEFVFASVRGQTAPVETTNVVRR